MEGYLYLKVYKEPGWEWLTQCRCIAEMTHFYKIVNKISPKYLTDCITFPDPPWISVYGRQLPNVKGIGFIGLNGSLSKMSGF